MITDIVYITVVRTRENKEKETAMETVNGIIPQGWVLELYAEVRHPTTRMRGNLIRNIETGRYAMLEGQTICSVPQEWARRQIAK